VQATARQQLPCEAAGVPTTEATDSGFLCVPILTQQQRELCNDEGCASVIREVRVPVVLLMRSRSAGSAAVMRDCFGRVASDGSARRQPQHKKFGAAAAASNGS
jgi:hypothetical protein